MKIRVLISVALAMANCNWILGQTLTDVEPPGEPFQPPSLAAAADGPVIYEYSREAGPDQTLFMVGERLSGDVIAWGPSASKSGGQEWKPKVQLNTGTYLAATLPEGAPDGVFLVWARNAAGYSRPVVLNRPEPWWCGPDVVRPGQLTRVFGRNLARRPDFGRGYVYLRKPGQPGVWTRPPRSGKYSLVFVVPASLTPGTYEVWVHAGQGGNWGWGGPITLHVQAPEHAPTGAACNSQPELPADSFKRHWRRPAIVVAARFSPSGRLHLQRHPPDSGPCATLWRGQFADHPATRHRQHSPIRSPRRPGLEPGAGTDSLGGRPDHVPDRRSPSRHLGRLGPVWHRHEALQPARSERQSHPGRGRGRSGPAPEPAEHRKLGANEMVKGSGPRAHTRPAHTDWTNVKGGGISLDAYVLTLDHAFTPTMSPPPVSGPDRIVLQAEDCETFVTKEGVLPGGDRAAVWLSGDGAGLKDVTILGTPQFNIGVALRSATPTGWVCDLDINNVKVMDIDGKQAENFAVHAHNVLRAHVDACELWGRTPLFLSGARKSAFQRNKLISVTRFGGNSEAAILGRTEPIEECIIENNRVLAPEPEQAGGPTARRCSGSRRDTGRSRGTGFPAMEPGHPA